MKDYFIGCISNLIVYAWTFGCLFSFLLISIKSAKETCVSSYKQYVKALSNIFNNFYNLEKKLEKNLDSRSHKFIKQVFFEKKQKQFLNKKNNISIYNYVQLF